MEDSIACASFAVPMSATFLYLSSQVFLNNIELQPITIPDYRLSLVDIVYESDGEKVKRGEDEGEEDTSDRHSSFFLSPLKQIDITIIYSLHKFSFYTILS